jgi:hypothetical protein
MLSPDHKALTVPSDALVLQHVNNLKNAFTKEREENIRNKTLNLTLKNQLEEQEKRAKSQSIAINLLSRFASDTSNYYNIIDGVQEWVEANSLQNADSKETLPIHLNFSIYLCIKDSNEYILVDNTKKISKTIRDETFDRMIETLMYGDITSIQKYMNLFTATSILKLGDIAVEDIFIISLSVKGLWIFVENSPSNHSHLSNRTDSYDLKKNLKSCYEIISNLSLTILDLSGTLIISAWKHYHDHMQNDIEKISELCASDLIFRCYTNMSKWNDIIQHPHEIWRDIPNIIQQRLQDYEIDCQLYIVGM